MSNQIAAVAEVPAADVGAASGLVTAAFQVGGAIGLAIVFTAATSRATAALAAGAARADAHTAGYHRGVLVAAGLAVLDLIVGALTAPRINADAEMVAQATGAG